MTFRVLGPYPSERWEIFVLAQQISKRENRGIGPHCGIFTTVMDATRSRKEGISPSTLLPIASLTFVVTFVGRRLVYGNLHANDEADAMDCCEGFATTDNLKAIPPRFLHSGGDSCSPKNA
jgi:hypothetical protein